MKTTTETKFEIYMEIFVVENAAIETATHRSP